MPQFGVLSAEAFKFFRREWKPHFQSAVFAPVLPRLSVNHIVRPPIQQQPFTLCPLVLVKQFAKSCCKSAKRVVWRWVCARNLGVVRVMVSVRVHIRVVHLNLQKKPA